MVAGENGSGWGAKKVLALLIPVCVVVIAVTVILVLFLGNSDTKKSGSTGKPAAEEEITGQYEQIKQDANAAVKHLEQLETQQAQQDSAAYQQQIEQANAEIEQLEQDAAEALTAVEQASAEVSSASGTATEVALEYEAFLKELEAYYAYVEGLTQQAVAQVEYLKSVAPTIQDVQQWQQLAARLGKAPTPALQRQLSGQLTGRAQQALSGLQSSTTTAPDSLKGYGDSIQALTGQLGGISEQMSQALASGNKASFDALSNQMTAAMDQAQQQLTGAFDSFSSGLSSAASKVDAAMPNK